MKKLLGLCLITLLAFVPLSFASVGIYEDGTHTGVASDFKFIGSAWTDDGFAWTFPLVIAGPKDGSATSMASTDTAVALTSSIVKKHIGPDTGQAGTLADGTDGQILTIIITTTINDAGSSGTFALAPTTTTGFDTATFDTAGESLTLLFVDSTIGWIVVGNNGAALTGSEIQ